MDTYMNMTKYNLHLWFLPGLRIKTNKGNIVKLSIVSLMWSIYKPFHATPYKHCNIMVFGWELHIRSTFPPNACSVRKYYWITTKDLGYFQQVIKLLGNNGPLSEF